MLQQNYETIVIGLGAAGVTAAATLGRAGRRVLALEAQDRIGGRVHTVPFGEGVVELGAEWVHGSQPSRIYDMAVQNNMVLVPQDLIMAAYQSNGVKPDDDFQNIFNVLVDYLFEHLDNSEKSEPLGQFATKKLLEHIKENYPELFKDEFRINMILEFMNQITNNYNASNDWNEVDSQSKYETLEGHLHLSWHKYGYKTFIDLLLNKEVGFPHLEIKLNTEVSNIEWSQDPQKKVVVTCTNGEIYAAEYVIVTISLGVLKERHASLFKPQLPKEKVSAIETIAMGVMDKIELSFDEIWWPLDAVFFAFLWTEEDRRKISKKDLWTTKVFAASRPMGSKNVLTLWTSGDIGKLVETLPIDEVKIKCKEILQRFMGVNNFTVPEPTDIKRSTWFSNPFTRGSYSFDSIRAAHYPKAREDLAAPLVDAAGKPRVLFAGEATDSTHFSTVHGASDSGHREAMRILPGGSKI